MNFLIVRYGYQSDSLRRSSVHAISVSRLNWLNPLTAVGLGKHGVVMDLGRLLLWGILVANLAMLPFFVYLFVVSLAAGLAQKPRTGWQSSSRRFLVAIPAHDEEAGIASTVRSCLAVDYPSELFEVLVIADNCQDQTAALALR